MSDAERENYELHALTPLDGRYASRVAPVRERVRGAVIWDSPV